MPTTYTQGNVPREALTVAQAADYLGISPQTLNKMCREGQIPYFITRGFHKRFWRSDLDGLSRSAYRVGPAHAAVQVAEHRAEYTVESKDE